MANQATTSDLVADIAAQPLPASPVDTEKVSIIVTVLVVISAKGAIGINATHFGLAREEVSIVLVEYPHLCFCVCANLLMIVDDEMVQAKTVVNDLAIFQD